MTDLSFPIIIYLTLLVALALAIFYLVRRNQAVQSKFESLQSIELNRHIIEAQKKFGKSVEKMAVIFDHLREGIIVVDDNQKVTMINRAAKSMFGVPESLQNQTFLIDIVQSETLVNLVSSAMQKKSRETETLTVRRTQDLDLKVYAIGLDSQDKDSAGILIAYDVTDINKLEGVRKDFVANVSHELKTPLTSIKGFAETLLSGDVTDPTLLRKFLTIIKEDSDRLERLIQDVLELSRIESGNSTQKEELIDLKELINETTTLLNPQIQAKHIKIAQHLPEKSIQIAGNHDQLLQVFVNLVDNAVKYNRPEGSIKIVVEHNEPNFISIHINDTGMGISEDHLERIFERFYRVDAARSRELGGTGLGLSIAKHIVEAHRGRIECTSTLGEGTTFSVVLPYQHF